MVFRLSAYFAKSRCLYRDSSTTLGMTFMAEMAICITMNSTKERKRMERNDEITALTEAFKSYRDLLIPLKESLFSFADNYESVKSNIIRLNNAFDGDIQGKLQTIMSNLNHQALKANDLAVRIDQFVSITNKYVSETEKVFALFGSLEKKLSTVTELEKRAEDSLEKIDAIAEEKKKSYNLTQLQKSLESYNSNLQTVSEFINKDVAKVMADNTKKLEGIKNATDSVEKKLSDEGTAIQDLAKTYQETNALLKNLVAKNDVNEEYLFDILDRWAMSRKIKTKK